jgi:uncharacterized protein
MPLEALIPVVFAGAFAQSATGVGFGVIAGPFLLHAYGYERAIAETAVFSILVAAISASRVFASAEMRATISLSVTLPVGVALGLAVLLAVPRAAVLGLFGLMLTGLGLALVRQECKTPTNVSAPSTHKLRIGREMALAGVLAGAGAALFAAPGPAAAWGLARMKLSPRSVRATLAVYFVLAYATILAAFATAGMMSSLDQRSLSLMAPVCALGAVAGIIYGDRISGRILRMTIGFIVAASGLSILATLTWSIL